MARKCFMCGGEVTEGILCGKCDKPRRKSGATQAAAETAHGVEKPEEAVEYTLQSADIATIAAEPGVTRIGRLGVPRGALGWAPQAVADSNVIGDVRALMWRDVGLVREAAGLEAALEVLGRLRRRARTVAERNRVLVAELIAQAALARRESRGSHYRRDYPVADPAQARRSFTRCRRAASVTLRVPARSQHREIETHVLALRKRALRKS